jgi:hypothetical protein
LSFFVAIFLSAVPVAAYMTRMVIRQSLGPARLRVDTLRS